MTDGVAHGLSESLQMVFSNLGDVIIIVIIIGVIVFIASIWNDVKGLFNPSAATSAAGTTTIGGGGGGGTTVNTNPNAPVSGATTGGNAGNVLTSLAAKGNVLPTESSLYTILQGAGNVASNYYPSNVQGQISSYTPAITPEDILSYYYNPPSGYLETTSPTGPGQPGPAAVIIPSSPLFGKSALNVATVTTPSTIAAQPMGAGLISTLAPLRTTFVR